MRKLVCLAVLVMFALALTVCASADIDESKLSPEAKALKAKYDAQIKSLEDAFMAELGKLQDRVEKVEGDKGTGAKKWYDSLMFNGYFQTRFTARDYEGSGGERDDFGIRRLYLNAIAPLGKDGLAVVTWAGVGPDMRMGNALTSETDWANVFVEFNPAPEWKVRMGQAPTWFGIDTCESSSCRFTPERFAASEGIPGLGLLGLYFAGPWDRGIWVVNDQTKLSDDGTGLRTVFSVHNGQFRNNDADNHKNLSVDAEYFAEWGQFGASWLDGVFAGTARDAIGLNVRVFPDLLVPNWGFQAEWLEGEMFGTDMDGFYGQASYHFPGGQNILYARYEEFDPAKLVANDEYEALHIGAKHKLTPKDEITVEYTLGELGMHDANDLIVQWQRMF